MESARFWTYRAYRSSTAKNTPIGSDDRSSLVLSIEPEVYENSRF
eukprot:SAG11_NODE_837_length_6925_cov_43.745532_6_plen_45_part_00